MKRHTINEIASLSGVSPATVSRVLNNYPKVREEVRQRVLRVIDENGYVPNASAQSLARRRSGIIALVTPTDPHGVFSAPYFREIIPAIIERCNQLGYLLNLAVTPGEAMQREFYKRVVRSGQADGVILLNPEMDEPILPLLVKDGSPLVMFGRHAYLRNISWVDVDNRDGGYQATAHLIRLGYRRIATIAGNQRAAWGIDRLDGYRQALAENGFIIDPRLVQDGQHTSANGYAAMLALLDQPEPPDAIFVAGEEPAAGALQALRERGIQVPRDFGVVAYGDYQPEVFAPLRMTAVDQPTAEVGAAAVDLLLDRIQNPDQPPVHKVFPVELIVRESCGAALRSPALQEKEGKTPTVSAS